MIKILFVCMGNICRSPTAEGVFRKKLEEAQLLESFWVDSAGTHGYHVGRSPDPRTQVVASSRGIDLSDLKSRLVELSDFEVFDHILVMDSANYSSLTSMSPKAHHPKIQYLMKFAPQWEILDVPDPYYGGERGFERVLDMIEDASEGLLTFLQSTALEKP